jgi:hypothetical protein
MFHMATRMVHHMNSREAYPGTQAVLRAVRLLKAIGAQPGEPTLAELVRTVGSTRPRPTGC